MRNKKNYITSGLYMLLVCAMIATTGCGKDQDLLVSESLVSLEEDDIGTFTVKYENVQKEVKLDGEVYYPVRADLTSPADGYTLKEVLVVQKQSVKKGEVLANLEAVSEEERQDKQEVIEAKKRQMESVRSFTQQEIASYQSQLAQAASEYDRKIYQLRIEEKQLTLAHMEAQYAEEITAMEQEMEQMESVSTTAQIAAPYDGVIDSVNHVSEGSVLTTSRKIIGIYSSDTMVIKAKNKQNLRYNDTVKVLAGSMDARKEYNGIIVGADNALADQMQDGNVYIKITDEFHPDDMKNIEIIATGYNVEQVLVVKSNAVFEQKGEKYVYLLVDGKLMQRHIKVGGSAGDYTWVLQGLEEGDVVSIQ